MQLLGGPGDGGARGGESGQPRSTASARSAPARGGASTPQPASAADTGFEDDDIPF
jgi:single-stranded DNA-binding protein